MTEVWQSTASVATILATAWLSIVFARILGRRGAEVGALSRRVDDLAIRLQLLEARRDPRVVPKTARRRDRRIDPPVKSAVQGPTLIAVPSLASPGSEAVASEASAELGRRFGAIWTMADAGDSLGSIAKATGHPVGQVELILGLRRPSWNLSETLEAETDA